MVKKSTFIITTIVLCVLLLACIGTSVFYDYAKNTTTIFDKNINKVVEVKVSNDGETWAYATGCFVDGNGLILTNKHVAYSTATSSNYNFIKVRLASSEDWIDAQVIKVSENEDLATIKIEKNNTPFFSVRGNVKNGETIYTIGNPNGFGLSFTAGVVSSNLRNVVYNEKTISAIQTSFVINEGNSGGPVFDCDGKMLGIISFRLKDQHGDVIQGVSFAIPYNFIQSFLDTKTI